MAAKNNRNSAVPGPSAAPANPRAFPDLTQFQQEVASEIGIDLGRLQPEQEQVRQWEQSTHSQSRRSR